MREWWVLEISAKRAALAARLEALDDHISHSGLERSSCWVKMPRRPGAGAAPRSPGAGSARLAHVVLEVEGRVVHPQRPPGLQRRRSPAAGGSAAPGAGGRGCGRGLLERRRRSLEDREPPRRACATSGPPGAGTTRRAPSGGRSAPEPSASPLAHPQNAGGYKRRNAGARRPLRLRSARAPRGPSAARAGSARAAKRRGMIRVPWPGTSRPSPSSRRSSTGCAASCARRSGRSRRWPASSTRTQLDRDLRAAAGAGQGARAVGGAPRPRARRPGLRPGQARADARDPRHLAVRAERVRQPGARLRQLARSSRSPARPSRRSASCTRCSPAT